MGRCAALHAIGCCDLCVRYIAPILQTTAHGPMRSVACELVLCMFMLPKRRCWKMEQKVGRAFARARGPKRVHSYPRKVARKCTTDLLCSLFQNLRLGSMLFVREISPVDKPMRVWSDAVRRMRSNAVDFCTNQNTVGARPCCASDTMPGLYRRHDKACHAWPGPSRRSHGRPRNASRLCNRCCRSGKRGRSAYA